MIPMKNLLEPHTNVYVAEWVSLSAGKTSHFGGKIVVSKQLFSLSFVPFGCFPLKNLQD